MRLINQFCSIETVEDRLHLWDHTIVNALSTLTGGTGSKMLSHAIDSSFSLTLSCRGRGIPRPWQNIGCSRCMLGMVFLPYGSRKRELITIMGAQLSNLIVNLTFTKLSTDVQISRCYHVHGADRTCINLLSHFVVFYCLVLPFR